MEDFGSRRDTGGCRIDINILESVDFLFQELAVAGATATITGPLHNTDIKYRIMGEQGFRMELWASWTPACLWANSQRRRCHLALIFPSLL